jgi:hypothetical protein
LTRSAELKQAHTLFYKAYLPLEGTYGSEISIRTAEIAEIEGLIGAKRWDDARERSSKLINLSLAGLQYLQTYANAHSAIQKPDI